MNFNCVLVFVIFISAFNCNALPFNVDDYLYDGVWMRKQINCLLDKGVCDDTGKLMKALAPYYIKTRCNTCAPDMKQAYHHSVGFMQKNYRREWYDIKDKYNK